MRPRYHAGLARRRLGVLSLSAGLLLVPAALARSASAAAIAVNKPCYVFAKHHPATMVVSGSGFVPGDTVRLSSSLGWDSTESATAGPAGSFTAAYRAPQPTFALPGQKTVTLTAEDLNSGLTISAQTPVTVAHFDVSTSPAAAPATRKVTWYLAGFRPSKLIYVHYLHPKPVARMRLGRANGPCGVLKARARFYPGGHPRFRKYNVQIDDARRYSKHATPRFDAAVAFSVS